MGLTDIVFIFVSCLGFMSTFLTVYDLIHFLSYFDRQHAAGVKCCSVISALTLNTALVLIFVIQHSLMATTAMKNVMKNLGIGVVERSVYLLFTSAALQLMMRLWTALPGKQLWSVHDTILEWPVRMLHLYAWLVIYMSSISMDLPELLGIKQVYYAMNDLPEPLVFKSVQLRRLFLHMRHPSFSYFNIILLFCPVMTVDRLLLACLWIVYMMARWKIDAQDYNYAWEQFQLKCRYLNRDTSYQSKMLFSQKG